MRASAVLALVILVAVAMAGCADSGGNPGDSATSSSSDSSSATNSTTNTTTSSATTSTSQTSTSTGPSAGANHAPVATVTLATGQSPSGPAPLTVTFMLNGSDADNDTLSWTLAFGDASPDATGTVLPGQSNHTYTATGNFTAKFTVTDGKESVNATYAITVAANAPAGKPPIVLSGSYVAPDPTELVLGAGCLLGDFPGEPFGSFAAVPAAAIGGAYTTSATSPSYYYFLAEDFEVLNGGESSGTVPAKSANVYVCASGPTSANVDWSVSIVPI